MKRLTHVPGTKERRIGRECLTFTHANYGPVIIDRVHPDDRDEMFGRLWDHYGKGSVWASPRRMKRGESYIELDTEQVAS